MTTAPKLNKDEYQRAKQALISGDSKTRFLSVKKFKPKRVGQMVMLSMVAIIVIGLIITVCLFVI
jgi:hypothetical protein